MSDIDLAPDVLVVGGGLAGVIAAARAREKGARVVLVRKAGGGSALSSGAIDVADELAGAVPGGAQDPLERGGRARRAADALAARQPRHPYARVGSAGRERLREAMSLLRALARPMELAEREDGLNHVLATQLGTIKRSAAVQRSQLLDLTALEENTSVGVVQLSDLAGFDARPVAHALAWAVGLGKKPLHVIPIVVPRTREGDALVPLHHAPVDLALRLDDPARRGVIIDAVRAAVREQTRIPSVLLFPPALGMEHAREVTGELEKATGKVVRELLATSPSVPGERLMRALLAGVRARGVTVVDGVVSSAQTQDRRAHKLVVEGTRVRMELQPRAVVLAAGRFLGGGIVREQSASEPLFGLPVHVGGALLSDRFVGDFLGQRPTADHELFRAGVRVDDKLRPVDAGGTPLFDNLTCAGSVVEGWDPARDGAAGGVAVLTGFLAGEHSAHIAKGER